MSFVLLNGFPYPAPGAQLPHLLTTVRYGIFPDAMYYLACSQHLAWDMWTIRR